MNSGKAAELLPEAHQQMMVVAIIPARYSSTRFPGKVLVDICGKPMIQHVFERVRRSSLVGRVVVATDDERVKNAVEGFGGTAVMTSADHQTGTDRIAEVARGMEAEVVVNVQGDEPLISPMAIDEAVRPLLEEIDLDMSTLKCPIEHAEEFFDPNVVKVITDINDYAIYFSRWPIPFHREDWSGLIGEGQIEVPQIRPRMAFRHIGLYAYRRDFLLRFADSPQTPLEMLEKLEQLRALENGYKIKVVETDYRAVGVDVPEDLARVIGLLQ